MCWTDESSSPLEWALHAAPACMNWTVLEVKVTRSLRAASQIRLLPRLQHSSKFCSGGVYTAPHANETKCDQSLALELKITPYEKKNCKPVFESVHLRKLQNRRNGENDMPLLGDSPCSVYRLFTAITEWWFYIAKAYFFFFWCLVYCLVSVPERGRVRANVCLHSQGKLNCFFVWWDGQDFVQGASYF